MENQETNSLSPRLQYLLDHYGQQVSGFMDAQEGLKLDARKCIEVFANADPSRNKSATQWLLATYLKNGFKAEDIAGEKSSKVFETLGQFGLMRKKLPVEQRDLNYYSSLGAMWNAIKGFVAEEKSLVEARELDALTGKALRRAEKVKALEETFTLLEDPNGFKIVSPLTEYASCWWGRGTRWCTAAENNNYFAHYYEKAPLLIVITPEGNKYQMFVTPHNFQFTNDNDEIVDRHTVVREWDYFKPLFHHALSIQAEIMKHIPFDVWTTELADIICQSSTDQSMALMGFLLYFSEEKTYDLYLKFVKNSGSLLSMVPREMLSREICLEAVKQYGLVLEEVPEEFVDEQMCDIAVANNGLALWGLPQRYLTEERCMIAVKQNGQSLSYVPQHMKTREMCLEALRQKVLPDVLILSEVPESLLDSEICTISITQQGENLRYVPQHIKTREMCLLALQREPSLFTTPWVSEYKHEAEFIMAVVQSNGAFLSEIPLKERTEEINYEAVKNSPTALAYVHSSSLTAELVIMALQQDGMALRTPSIWYSFSQKWLQTFFLEAVTQNGKALDLIPTAERTFEICQMALKNAPAMLRAVPSEILIAHPELQGHVKMPRHWELSTLEELKLKLSAVEIPTPNLAR
jgi:hypothetical protein